MRTVKKCNEIKDDVEKILSKCRKIVGLFHHSSILHDELKITQNELKYETKIKLIQEVPTRWNTTFAMLDSIITNKDALVLISLKPENKTLKNLILNEDEFIFIDQICDILEPLSSLTDFLSGSKYATTSILYPSIYQLIVDLEEIQVSNEMINLLKNELVHSIRGRFTHVFENKIFLAFTLLDFRFKNFSFINNPELRGSQSYARQKFV